MEGLIPLVYRAIAQFKNGGQGNIIDAWLNESPSPSYTRLSGDSSASDIELFRPDCGFSAFSPPPSAAKGDASAAIQPPAAGQQHHLTRAVK
ncbi:hypothetical protein ABFX02_12G172900 [Erythranthe guttata]